MLKDYTLENLTADCKEAEIDIKDAAAKVEQWDAKKWALFEYSNRDVSLIDDIDELDIEDEEINFNGEYLLILEENEADDRWEQELDSYIEECIYPELPENLQNYFDEDAWKRDARFDGRGHAISRYDGVENEFCIKFDDDSQEYINIYRM